MISNIEKLFKCFLYACISASLVVSVVLYKQMKDQERQDAITVLKAVEVAAKKSLEESKPKKLQKDSVKFGYVGVTTKGQPFGNGVVSTAGRTENLITNISPEKGYFCYSCVAKNKDGKNTARSLPACVYLEPFAANQTITVYYGGRFDTVCKNWDECDIDCDAF